LLETTFIPKFFKKKKKNIDLPEHPSRPSSSIPNRINLLINHLRNIVRIFPTSSLIFPLGPIGALPKHQEYQVTTAISSTKNFQYSNQSNSSHRKSSKAML
jgi:hypothetical protein